MNTSSYHALEFHRAGRVLTIAMNRPEARNCINEELHEELARVFYDAAADRDSDVIILTGKGAAFSVGGDLKWLNAQFEGTPTPFVLESCSARRVVDGILNCPKPIVAKINGDAIGLGATLALLADVSIASESARIADPHVRVGLVAGDGGALIWPQLIGFAKARHYLLTGEAIVARDAERMNLISFAVAAQQLDTFVDEYAARLAKGAQTAIRYTKTAINVALRQLFNSVFEVGLAYEGLSKVSAEHREGVKAFLENRRPDFPPIE
jgi:enoyl-CoA hydratase